MMKNYRNSLELLDKAFNYKSNVLKINIGNGIIHELAKFFLFWEARYNSHDVITEAIFKNGSRADIYILDGNIPEAWEVLSSETIKSFKEQKIEKYPCRVIPFDAKNVISQNMRGIDYENSKRNLSH